MPWIKGLSLRVRGKGVQGLGFRVVGFTAPDGLSEILRCDLTTFPLDSRFCEAGRFYFVPPETRCVRIGR